jgi:hypothetical protein
MRAHFAREAESDGPWTSYNASLGRPLLNSAKFLQGEKAAEAVESSEEPSANTDTPAPSEPSQSTADREVLNLLTQQKA